ncbi:S-adenosylmethionine mitochondrial carrier protein [Anthophora quadrimaculata]
MIEGNSSTNSTSTKNVFLTPLISGALAGTICDFVSFPLDTLKTRLQSQHGFIRSGGFNQLYKGLGPVLIGSAPSASLFFVTYEGIKLVFQPCISEQYHMFIHMTAASVGEMVACLIRVPVEVLKQRRQAFLCDTHRLSLRTLYRGYGSTVIRDLPFGLIQMPLWEYFKLCWKKNKNCECTPVEGAICGSVSVGISAMLTTPLDVAKTRIMLSSTMVDKDEIKISVMLKNVYRESGFRGLFAGFLPRVGGFTISGFIFFGVYEKVREICISLLPP